MLPLYGKELRMVNKFFSITEDNTGRYVIYVFGFRIRFLKSFTKEERKNMKPCLHVAMLIIFRKLLVRSETYNWLIEEC